MALDVWDQQDSIWIILEGGDKLLDEVNEFCDMHKIHILGMDETYIVPQKPKEKNLEWPTSITIK